MFSRCLLRTVRTMSQGPAAKGGLTAFKVGMTAVGVTGAGGLAYSLRYALAPAENANIRNVALWPQYVKDRVAGTFGYCMGGLGVTAAAAMASVRSQAVMRLVGGNTMMSFVGCMALMMGSGMLCRGVPFDGSPVGTKAALYYLHMAIVGAVIAPIMAVGGPVCLRAAAATMTIMGGLAFTGMVAPSDAYIKMYGPINAGCFLMLGACVASYFAAPMGAVSLGLESFIMLGGLILFTGKGFMDLQHASAAAQQPGAFDPVNHSLSITMDAVNIFIRLAMMMSGSKRK